MNIHFVTNARFENEYLIITTIRTTSPYIIVYLPGILPIQSDPFISILAIFSDDFVEVNSNSVFFFFSNKYRWNRWSVIISRLFSNYYARAKGLSSSKNWYIEFIYIVILTLNGFVMIDGKKKKNQTHIRKKSPRK